MLANATQLVFCDALVACIHRWDASSGLLQAAQIDQLLREADQDGNGYLQPEEIVLLLEKMMELNKSQGEMKMQVRSSKWCG